MSANPCPNNTWNHTSGCTCVSNGSVTGEVDIDLMGPATSGPPTPDYVRDPNASIPGGAAEAAANMLRRALESDETDAGRAYAAYDYAIKHIDMLTPGVTQARMAYDSACEESAWRSENSYVPYGQDKQVVEARRAEVKAWRALEAAREAVGYRAPMPSAIHSSMGTKEMSPA